MPEPLTMAVAGAGLLHAVTLLCEHVGMHVAGAEGHEAVRKLIDRLSRRVREGGPPANHDLLHALHRSLSAAALVLAYSLHEPGRKAVSDLLKHPGEWANLIRRSGEVLQGNIIEGNLQDRWLSIFISEVKDPLRFADFSVAAILEDNRTTWLLHEDLSTTLRDHVHDEFLKWVDVHMASATAKRPVNFEDAVKSGLSLHGETRPRSFYELFAECFREELKHATAAHRAFGDQVLSELKEDVDRILKSLPDEAERHRFAEAIQSLRHMEEFRNALTGQSTVLIQILEAVNYIRQTLHPGPPDTGREPPAPWTTATKLPADWQGGADNGYAKAIMRSVDGFCDRTRADAKRRAEQAIMNTMGSLTERFGATSAWLFLLAEPLVDPWIIPGSGMSSAFGHNTGLKNLRPDSCLTGHGIVGHVAALCRPYLSNDVTTDPHYQQFVQSTKSELAAPIICKDSTGTDRLIGVLNLESSETDAFLESHPGELMAAASKLAPEILIFQYLKQHPLAFGWHPAATGWTLEHLLQGFCAAVSFTEKLDQQEPLDRINNLPPPSCTVWHLDREAGRLFVRGTARFDYEYINRRALDQDSFTWQAAHLPEDTVASGTPDQLPGFQRKRKGRSMGLAYAFAAPIHLSREKHPSPAVGTVNLYFFLEDLKGDLKNRVDTLKSIFPMWLLLLLANRLATLIEHTQELRNEVAATYLRYRQHEHGLPGLTEFDALKDTILTCLDADCCSIFAREPHTTDPQKKGKLRCVATTGVCLADGTAVDLPNIVYDLDDPADRGIAAFLAEKCDQRIRCRSIAELSTRAADLKLSPVNKFRETYSHTDTEHRPFLGISVDNPVGSDASKLPSGIIRVLRRSGSRPFVRGDELLLRRLVRDSHCLFNRIEETWPPLGDREQAAGCGARYPFLIHVAGRSTTQQQLNAIDKLGGAFAPGTVWNRRQVEAVLLDLINLFSNPERMSGRHGGLIANFRLTQPGRADSAQRKHRVFALHAPLSSNPPPEELLAGQEDAEQSIGLYTISHGRAVTFDADKTSKTRCPRFVPILPESDRVTSGACIPVRFLSRRGPVLGVLSIDCDHLHFDEWSQEHLLVLSLAAKRLDFVGRDNCLQDGTIYRARDWREAVGSFLRQLCASSRLHVRVCNIEWNTLWHGIPIGVNAPRSDPALKPGRNPHSFIKLAREDEYLLQELSNDWSPVGNSMTDSWTLKGGFRLNLSFGAFDTGLQLIGAFRDLPSFNDSPAAQRRCLLEEWITSRVVEISHLWNRFTNVRVGSGVTPLFSVSFSEGQPSDGTRVWEENVVIAPEVFGRGQVPPSAIIP